MLIALRRGKKQFLDVRPLIEGARIDSILSNLYPHINPANEENWADACDRSSAGVNAAVKW